MPSIKIGDKVCDFEGRKTILQVAMENDIEIPHYCYHPGLSIVASCRICLAEVAQPNPRKDNELEKIPKLVPTCQHPAVDGAEVYLESEATQANQKAVMEYLLINHPLDCPVCDQAGECHLQDYSYRYGRAQSRFEENKVKNPKKDIGDHVLLYADRCIMCSRCVRFTREVSETGEIGVQGRGNTEEIDIFPGRPLNNELSGNVVDLCPVGALLDKDFLFEQRVWYLSSTPSIDGITASGDNIYLDHNEGRVWRIKPRTNLQVNQWWISDEIRYGWKHVHAEDRLSEPTRQVAGGHEAVSWNDGLAAAVEGIRNQVEQDRRLAVMVSPMLSCEDAALLGRLALAMDERAILAVGPVPRSGEDKTFSGGYTIRAEKAPNARGVRRALESVGGKTKVLDYAKLIKAWEKDKKIGAVIMTGNYPSAWAPKALLDVLDGQFAVLIDTLPTALGERADVVLPGATWAEKNGTFENADNRLQVFAQAIPVREGARTEGQIALDLLAEAGAAEPVRFDAEAIRQELGGAFVDEVHLPDSRDVREPDMQFAEI